MDLSALNLDSSHAIAKKGSKSVVYQGRKKAKTSNILPLSDGNGFIITSTDIIAGNHNDAFQLKYHLQIMFKQIKQMVPDVNRAYFNADIDKFKRLLIRFERKDIYFLAGHYIAFAMINLRHILA